MLRKGTVITMVTKHYVSKKYYENINDKYKTPNDLYFIKDTGEIFEYEPMSFDQVKEMMLKLATST